MTLLSCSCMPIPCDRPKLKKAYYVAAGAKHVLSFTLRRMDHWQPGVPCMHSMHSRQDTTQLPVQSVYNDRSTTHSQTPLPEVNTATHHGNCSQGCSFNSNCTGVDDDRCHRTHQQAAQDQQQHGEINCSVTPTHTLTFDNQPLEQHHHEQQHQEEQQATGLHGGLVELLASAEDLDDAMHDAQQLFKAAERIVRDSCGEEWLVQPFIPDMERNEYR